MLLDDLLEGTRLRRSTALAAGVLVLVLTCALPLLGVWLSGDALGQYLHFPPSISPGDHAGFSWVAFIAGAITDLALLGALLGLLFYAAGKGGAILADAPHKETKCFPLWGWAAVALLALSWLIAWTRFDFVGAFQRHTFFPLWLSFILVVNGLCEYRKRSSPLLQAPGWFLLLFPVSALFWWVFEYLNAFTSNWHYSGVDPSEPLNYFLSATLPFSTVLPAVMSVCALLVSFEAVNEGLKRGPRLAVPGARIVASAALLVNGVALMFVGVFPDFLFPALWISPLVFFTSLQTLTGSENIFSPLRYGDWRSIVIPALAGLLCGFCWELWNVNSLAQWDYSIPFVDRFPIFAMPVVGYGGYLPFGLECLVISQLTYRLLHPRS